MWYKGRNRDEETKGFVRPRKRLRPVTKYQHCEERREYCVKNANMLQFSRPSLHRDKTIRFTAKIVSDILRHIVSE
jgi:hypothetical protein